jgi:hypothetical protein
MTTETVAPTLRDVVSRALDKIAAHWPARKLTDDVRNDYGRALMGLADPDLVTAAIRRATETIGGPFPPQLADLLQIAEACRVEAAVAKSRPRQPDVSITAAALQDAITALHTAPHDEQERAYLEGQVGALRQRLSDHGRRTDERMRDGLRWFTAEPHPDEDDDVRRLVVILPDDTRRPPSARVLGEGRDQLPRVVPGVPQQGMSALPASYGL